MDAHLSFIGLIAAIGVIHLVAMAARHLGALRDNQPEVEKKLHSGTQQRNDWYVFFHCADLLGKEPNQAASGRANNGQPVQTPQPRREEGQRPRPRVRL